MLKIGFAERCIVGTLSLCDALCVPDVGAHGQGPLQVHGAREALVPPRVPPVEHARVPGVEPAPPPTSARARTCSHTPGPRGPGHFGQ